MNTQQENSIKIDFHLGMEDLAAHKGIARGSIADRGGWYANDL